MIDYESALQELEDLYTMPGGWHGRVERAYVTGETVTLYEKPYVLIEDGILKKYIFFDTCIDQHIEIPKKVETIASFAFDPAGIPEEISGIDDPENQEPQTITKIYIPETVKHIESNAFRTLRFLEEIEVHPDCPSAKLVNGVLYSKDGTTILHHNHSISGSCKIPEGVKRIASGAFEFCEPIDELVLPETIETIEDYAFANCEIRHMNIPDSLKNVLQHLKL